MVYSPHQWGIGNKGRNPQLIGGGQAGGDSFMPKMLGSMLGGGSGGGFSGGGSYGAAPEPTLMSGGPQAMALSGGGSGGGSADEEKKKKEVMDAQLQTAYNKAAYEADNAKKQMDKYYQNYLDNMGKTGESYWLNFYKKGQSQYNMAKDNLMAAWSPFYAWHQKTGTDLDPSAQLTASTHGLWM